MGLRDRLERLEEKHHRRGPQDEAQREKLRQKIRESAGHANYCGWGEDRWPLFEIAGNGDVFCTHDGKPVTDPRQILAECFYWMEVGFGGPLLLHDEEPKPSTRKRASWP